MQNLRKLDLSLTSSLRWEVEGDAQTLWELSLGEFDPEDEMHLQTLYLGLEHFVRHVWEVYGGAGVILYRGAATLSDAFLGALEMLGAVLPVTPRVELDAEGVEEERFYRLMMREALERFEVRVSGGFPIDLAAPLGLLFPDEGSLDLTKMPRPFRPIPETRLTHLWEGLDVLVVPGPLTRCGERMVQGFLAAGGEVITSLDDAASLRLPGTVLPSSLAASTQTDR